MSKIEEQVMAAVGVLYLARIATSKRALKVYALLLSFGGIAMFASLPNVAHNFGMVMANGLPSVGAYIVAAVLGTKIIVQLALAVGVVAGLLLLVDIARIAPRGRSLAA
jgi:hypothetical protein